MNYYRLKTKAMIKNILLLSLFLNSISFLNAQSIIQKTFGSSFKEYAKDSKPTEDGGIVILGDIVNPNNQLDADIFLIKIDSQNNIQWKKRYSLGDYDKSIRLEITPDNGFIIAGYTTAIDSGGFLIIRTDSLGNNIWSKTYGSLGPCDMKKTKDGGYILTGQSADIVFPFSGHSVISVLKIDSLGEIQWHKNFANDAGTIGLAIKQTFDNGYIITGYTLGFGAVGNGAIYLMKINENGNFQWAKSYDSSEYDSGNDIIITQDSGYLVTGTFWLKTDIDGNVQWIKKYYSNTLGVLTGERINTTFDKGYVFLCNIGFKLALLKMDSLENFIWAKRFNNIPIESGFSCFSVFETDDNYYTIASSIPNNNNDIYLVKTNSYANNCDNMITNLTTPVLNLTIQNQAFVSSDCGFMHSLNILTNPISLSSTIICDSSTIHTSLNEKDIKIDLVKIFPNPAINNITIECLQKTEIEILNIDGQIIKQLEIKEKNINVDISDFSSGVYFIKLKSDKEILTRKLIKL